MAEVPIRNRAGEVIARVLVDEADFAWAMQWKWSLSPAGYAMRMASLGGTAKDPRTRKQRGFSMARELMGLRHGDKREVDHLNGEPLDNRRSNLQVVPGRGLQMQNLRARRDGRSKYRGVTWCNTHKKWKARVKIAGAVHCLGSYSDELEAAAVCAAWREAFMPNSEEARA